MRFTGFGAVLLALLACGRGERNTKRNAPSATTPNPTSTERVVRTLPLELGEGDDRSVRVAVWPADGGAALELPAGTRIEKLEELPGAARPPLPDGGVPARAFWRCRVTEGPHKDLVFYVRSYQTQAAR
jgi:hypothetical protein